MGPVRVALAGVTLLCALPAAASRSNNFDSHAFLRTYAGFSAHDLARVTAGTAVARSLPAEGDEAAVATAVFMEVPRQVYVERFKDIESFKRTSAVEAIGRFSTPPSAADMRAFTIDDDDLEALRQCRPGDCGMRMDKEGMKRIQAAGAQNGDGDTRATAALREYLAAYTAEYLQRGDAALMEYCDREKPRRIAADLAPIIKRSPYFGRELSAIRADVAAFPGVAASPHEHMVYWSTEKIASAAVTSVTHAIIATPATGLTAIATRQIYASRFFHASLGLTLVSETAGPNGPGVTVIYINRSRVDAFSGLFGPVKRAAVRARVRSGSERLMRDLRLKMEKTK